MNTIVLPSALIIGSVASRPTGTVVARSRRPSQTIVVGLGGSAAGLSLGGGGVLPLSCFSVVVSPGDFFSEKRSRNTSSRYLGTWGVRSTRTIRDGSLRWPLSNSRYLPSGDQL